MNILNFVFLSVVFSLFSAVLSDDNYSQFTACCKFKSQDLKDSEYIIGNRFNEKLMVQYNSTRGNWTGFTAYSIEEVKDWNRHPHHAQQRALEKKRLCEDTIGLIFQHIDNLTVIPTIRLNLVKHQSVLVCSAYNFFPKQIRLTWLRNDQEVTSGVTFTEAFPSGDWSYQVHVYLEHTPTPGEKIICRVEHSSLSEPVFQVWDPSLSHEPDQIKIAMGLCGLTLGFVILSSGFIYYKKKCAAYLTLYQARRVLISVEHLRDAGATQRSEQ